MSVASDKFYRLRLSLIRYTDSNFDISNITEKFESILLPDYEILKGRVQFASSKTVDLQLIQPPLSVQIAGIKNNHQSKPIFCTFDAAAGSTLITIPPTGIALFPTFSTGGLLLEPVTIDGTVFNCDYFAIGYKNG